MEINLFPSKIALNNNIAILESKIIYFCLRSNFCGSTTLSESCNYPNCVPRHIIYYHVMFLFSKIMCKLIIIINFGYHDVYFISHTLNFIFMSGIARHG